MISEMKETDLGLLPESWDLQILGDLLYIKGRIGWKGLKKSEYLEEGYAIINGEQIISDKVNWNSVGRISKERFLESPEIILKRKDILMTKDGTIGKIAYVDHLPEDATVASGVFVIRKDSKLLHTKYLYNFFKSRYFKWLIKGRTEGSVIPHLYQRDFKEMMIPLPSFEEQKAIAKILTAFDDKIELLQAQNKTLEIMAQTIFKEWFGKYQVGHELPEGWSFSPLYSIARYINGAAFKSEDFSKDKTGLPIVKIVELKNGISDSTAFTKKVVDNKYYIDDGDILFSWSGNPETSIDVFLWSSGKAILNQHSFNVKVDDDNEKAWVYFLLKYKKSLFIHLAKMKQTTGLGHVTISDLKENHFATPPKDDRKRFGKVFNGFLQKIMTNQSQIQSLTKTRDTLLPKLMSGQVRVKKLKTNC